jgi:hypothetical protein
MTERGYEVIDHEAPAENAELSRLFIRTRDWLAQNADLASEDSDEILGFHQGLPIVNNHPHFQYTIPVNILRKFVPEAAQELEVGEGLTLVYSPAYSVPRDRHEERPSKFEFLPPRCEFVKQKPSGLVDLEALTIELGVDEKANQVYSSDHEIYRALPPPYETTRYMSPAEKVAYVYDMDTYLITGSECRELQQILERLDLMKDEIDASPSE